MAYVDDEAGRPRVRDTVRRDRFAATAGERLRDTTECRFSLLPYEELARTASLWYDACAEAVLRGNYAAIDKWIREQTKVAAEQGFELIDLMQVLRLCRQVAIEKEGWHEEQFSEVDAVVDECLAALRSQVRWDIPEGLNYLTGKGRAELELGPGEEVVTEAGGERRIYSRAKLRLPIRVRGEPSGPFLQELLHTENVARGGICFLSQHRYVKGMRLFVTYPYSEAPGALNQDYPAEVVRVDDRNGSKAVAVRFLVSLGKKA